MKHGKLAFISKIAAPLALSAVSALSCAGAQSKAADTPTTEVAEKSGKAAPHVITFIEDDFPRALAEAKAKKVPLFVDAWAPWCHSCLSMREYTFKDPQIGKLDAEMVFLSIDTEKESNSNFVSRYPNQVWPTLYIIDQETERATLKWGGTATAQELTMLVETAKSPSTEPHVAMFVAGQKAAASGDLGTAETKLGAALSSAPPRWVDRPRAVEALIAALSEDEKWADCASLAESELRPMPRSSSRATVLATAVDCVDEGNLGKDKSDALLTMIRAEIKASAPPDATLLADDRSALYDTLVSAEEKDTQSKEAAKTDADGWAKFLEGEATKASSKEARAVFDAHRLLAYTAAGREADAIPMLEQSQKDFPADYNPEARLAKVYFDQKDYPKAKLYVDAAMKKVYGPRTLRIASLGASIAKAQGDNASAAHYLREGLDRTQSLALTKRQKKSREATEADLAKLPK